MTDEEKCIEKAKECLRDGDPLDERFVDELISQSPLEIKEDIAMLCNQKKLSKAVVSGILLMGPPGTGKSVLAKAIAQKCNRPFKFLMTAFLENEFQDSGAQNIFRLIDPVVAENTPYAIILDEAQELSKQKSGKKDRSMAAALWSLVSAYKKNTNLLFIATTNDLKDIPGQLRSRMTIVRMDLPDCTKRKRVILYMLREIEDVFPLDRGCNEKYLTRLARRTNGFSVRDLENLINLTARIQNYRGGDFLEKRDFEAALVRMKKKIVQEAELEVEPENSWQAWAGWSWREIILPIGMFTANFYLQHLLHSRQLSSQESLQRKLHIEGLKAQQDMHADSIGVQRESLEIAKSGLKNQERANNENHALAKGSLDLQHRSYQLAAKSLKISTGMAIPGVISTVMGIAGPASTGIPGVISTVMGIGGCTSQKD